MASEGYRRLQSQILGYGHKYDQNVDQYCPPLVKTKKGEIAKRQPKVDPRNLQYWKAQCSFHGLKTTGRIDELRDRVRNRDRTKDARVKLVQDRIRRLLDLELDKLDDDEGEGSEDDATSEQGEDSNEDEDPGDFKASIVASSAQRAHSNLYSIAQHSSGMMYPAPHRVSNARSQPGPSYGAPDMPIGMNSHIYGFSGAQSSPMYTDYSTAMGMSMYGSPNQSAEATQLADDRRQEELQKAASLARQRAKEERYQALLSEAKKMQDWDITGIWEVHNDTLANYKSRKPADLSMKIFRDDFDFDQRGRPNSRNSEDSSEDEHDGYYMYNQPQRAPKAPATQRPDLPKFCAKFEFSILQGIMRLWPSDSRPQQPCTIKSNPTFNYVWRGRETGESEIESTADEKVFQIRFDDHGTTFEGTFGSTYVGYAEVIKGIKISHGHGQQKSSSEEWRHNSERQWNRESTGRWH